MILSLSSNLNFLQPLHFPKKLVGFVICGLFGSQVFFFLPGFMDSLSQSYEEHLMRQRVVFTDNLQEMKNLRKQLYSAAEYFELSYTTNNDHQRILVMESLKDYTIKALVNTIDHLGSVTSKIEISLAEKLGQVRDTELRFSCIEQRVEAWKELINRHGLAQQMFLIDTPTHHKHYILPATANTKEIQVNCTTQVCKNSRLDKFSDGIRDKTAASPFLSKRDMHPVRPSPEHSSSPRALLLMRSASGKVTEKNKPPLQSFPFIQTGSLISRLTSQNALSTKKQHLMPSVRKSNSSASRDQKNRDLDEYSSRTKRIFRAFVSMRKQNKDVRMQNYSGRT